MPRMVLEGGFIMPKKHNWRRRGDSAQLIVYIGADYKGNPEIYRKTIPYTTPAKIDKEWELFYAACANGSIQKSSSMTVSAMVEKVLTDKICPNAKKNTIKGYRTCQKRINAAIGNRKAIELKPVHIQEWINNMSDELAPKTVKNTYSFLHMCYDTAIGWELITKSPCHHVKLPKPKSQEAESFTADEVVSLLGAIEKISEDKHDYKVAILLALFGGLRQAEIFGIEEKAVNIDTGEIKITKTLNLERGGLYEDTPKTKSSIRTVVYPQKVMDEVRKLTAIHKELRLKLGTKWKGSTKLIQGANGSDMYPTNLWEFLNKLLKENDMRHIPFHALRHTYTSMLADMGKDLTEISKQLGHSQKTTTLNTYSHMFKELSKAKKATAEELSIRFLE